MGLLAGLIGGFSAGLYADLATIIPYGTTTTLEDDDDGGDTDWEGWWNNDAWWLTNIGGFISRPHRPHHPSHPIPPIGISTSICVAAAMHVVIFTMYLRMWAQRLSLLGPSGSLTRTIQALRSKERHVKWPFLVMIVAFQVCVWAHRGLCYGSSPRPPA